MPGDLANSLSAIECAGFGLLGALLILSGVLGFQAWKRSRLPPEEMERRRRAKLNTSGKLCAAELLDFRNDFLIYSYDVRGVEYTASQNISALAQFLPDDPSAVVRPVYIKYEVKNPANSMIVSEEWSGLGNNTPAADQRLGLS